MTFNKLSTSSKRLHRALLIDDDRFMLTVVGDMLRDLGVSGVTTASSGTEGMSAIDRMGSIPPDLVVCDLNMPNGDGFQFMEKLGAKGYSGGVIVLSGMDTRTMKSASLMGRFHRLNIVATLSKPIDAQALRSALASLS